MTAPTSVRSGSVRNAWLAMLGFPVSFLAAFGVGEGIPSAFGYPPGGDRWPPPLMIGLPATLLAVLVFGIPAFVSVRYALRAAAEGDRRGWIPAGIGLGLFVVFLLLNTVPMGQ